MTKEKVYMKKIAGSVLIVLLIAAGVAGCKKIIQAIFPGIDVDASTITLTLPPIPYAPPNEVRITTFKQHFNLDSLVKARTNGSFSSADVTSVKIKDITFKLLNPDQQNNLANFESVRFAFSSSSTPQVSDIAAINFPDTYADTYLYTAPSTTPDLRPYLNGNELIYDVYGKLRRITTKSITLTVNVTLRVQ